MKRWLLVTAIMFGAITGARAQFASYTYSSQDILIGANIVQSGGVTGKGVTFGVIDTGVAAPWIGFSGGRVASTPTSVCVITPSCTQSLAVTDDNGHGTFVASEIIGSVPSAGFVGVAPGGNVISVKVLNAAGSGSYNDVASGIITAVNRGAQVLNLSLGPFVQNPAMIAAINYAASRNAYVVFAGGNSTQALNNGVNITGLTDSAIQHLIFVGSTNAQKVISSFSNTPGKGSFVSTTGKTYAYDSMWVMADGENIWGASNYSTKQYGYSYVTQMSGTSMAAPQVAGALGLLISRWGFLMNTGTAATILELTAARMGNNAINTTDGDGFLRVDLAFQPIGTLQIPVNGKLTPLANAQIVSSSAFGNLGKVSAVLQNAVAYDSFQRDFAVTLGAAVTAKAATAPSVATAQVSGAIGGGARSLTDLGPGAWFATSFSGTPISPLLPGMGDHPNPGLIVDPTLPPMNQWSVAFSQQGNYIGIGQGSNVALALSDARWGAQSAFFNGDTDTSGALLGLVPAANFGAIGLKLSEQSHVFASVLAADGTTLAGLVPDGVRAKGAAFGYTVAPTKHWQVSVTTSALKETNMMLGSTSSGYLGLAPSTFTASVGIGTNIDLGEGYQLGFDASVASTAPAANPNSLITNTSRLTSAAFGVALSKSDFFAAHDKVGVAIKKPMRVYAGGADVALPVGTDDFGNPVIQQTRASLVPAASETDLELGYTRPLGRVTSAGITLMYRNQADNIPGARDAAAMLKFNAKF